MSEELCREKSHVALSANAPSLLCCFLLDVGAKILAGPGEMACTLSCRLASSASQLRGCGFESWPVLGFFLYSFSRLSCGSFNSSLVKVQQFISSIELNVCLAALFGGQK